MISSISVLGFRRPSAAEPRHRPAHGAVQTVLEVDEGVGGPQTVAQLAARDQIAGTLDQGDQQLYRLIGKADARAGPSQLA